MIFTIHEYPYGMAKKERLDLILVKRGLAESQSKAQALIMAGVVRVEGEMARKAGHKVKNDSQIKVINALPYVSRGGLKLAGALNDFAYDPAGLSCADVGACTGGFTDLLLQRGAHKVYAIDVGYGELAWKLRQDKRVVVIERTNARYIERLDEPIDLVVIDTSFISIKLLLPAIAGWLRPTGDVITLVKPQFEAEREEVGKGGIVRERRVHAKVLRDIANYATANGWTLCDATASPIRGSTGNQEFFFWLTLGAGQLKAGAIEQALQRAKAMGRK